MNIQDRICAGITDALHQLYDLESPEVKLERTNAKFQGDFTFVVFPYLRVSRKKPEDTAAEIGHVVSQKIDEVESYNVVKGFLNLSLSNAFWSDYLHSIQIEGEVAIPQIGQGEKVIVEYSSPNTNKPLHLGHIRNNVLGYSVSEILKSNGFEVIKSNIVNDRGIHICKSMLAWQRFGDGETPESSGIKGDHLVGKYYVQFDRAYKEQVAELTAGGMAEEEAKEAAPLMQEVRQMLLDWEAGDQVVVQLWKTMNQWVYDGFDSTYKRLGVDFDKIYYESDTYLVGKAMVLEGLEKGIFFQKEDGSVWVDLSDEGLDQKILLRSDGTSVYMTQDIGTAQLRYDDFHMDRSIYVVGNEQDYHFKVLQLVMKKLGSNFWEGIQHLSYGMVDLPSGKMKSREGTVVDADDLMDEMVETARKQTQALGKTEGMNEDELDQLYSQLGIGALKYFLLKVDAKNRMLFDPEESIDFQGNTGPFIQYTHTRIASVLSAAEPLPLTNHSSLNEEEKEVLTQLLHYPSKVNEAAKTYNPSLIANAAFELAKTYNKFYHQHSILAAQDESIRAFRLHLSEACGKRLKHAFGLLGIAMPQRM